MYTIKENPEDFYVREMNSAKLSSSGRYSYFALEKRNYTTLRAIQHIADSLGIPAKRFGFAGTKDKVAVTEQLVSVDGVPPEKLEKIMLKDIKIKYVGRSDKPLSLGELEGNFFRIIVRNADSPPKKIPRFRNLFGSQRFSKNNAEIGKLIIKSGFSNAVELILQSKGDYEALVARHLDKKPSDYVGAIRNIPLKILRMYVHAYQSKLWNILAESSDEEELPIIGFGTENLTEDAKNLLENEGINQRDFIIREIPELSSEGSSRKVFETAGNLEITKKGEKEYLFEFELPKGSYATVFIRQCFSCA